MSRRTVRMRHPETGASYDAPESAVPTLQTSGWEAVDRVPGQDSPTAGAVATGEQQVKTVRMRHPETRGTYDAPQSAVPTLQNAGWVLDGPAGQDDAQDDGDGGSGKNGPPAGGASEDGGLDAGGALQPGMTEARNDTGRPEPVIPDPKPRRGRRTPKKED